MSEPSIPMLRPNIGDSMADEVIVGYLVTLRDGFECRMGPDQARAENYAIQQRALSVETMFVRRTQ